MSLLELQRPQRLGVVAYTALPTPWVCVRDVVLSCPLPHIDTAALQPLRRSPSAVWDILPFAHTAMILGGAVPPTPQHMRAGTLCWTCSHGRC